MLEPLVLANAIVGFLLSPALYCGLDSSSGGVRIGVDWSPFLSCVPSPALGWGPVRPWPQ